jgi:non-lysosomal glucosylceramidase
MFDDLGAVDPRFIHEGERNRHVAFPLGGIGSGGFAISGSGRLIDWSIANRPGLQQFNGYSHFAIKAEQDGKLIDARVLNGPYDGNATGSPGMRPQFDGFGHGANRPMLAGLPHFRDVRFTGRFPTADVEFADTRFPGTIRLAALSPFIPYNDRDSSMPAAMFGFEISRWRVRWATIAAAMASIAMPMAYCILARATAAARCTRSATSPLPPMRPTSSMSTITIAANGSTI